MAPTSISDAIFLLVFICAITFHPLAWWRFGKASPALTSGQKKKSLVGLLANLVMLFLPVVYGLSAHFTLSLQDAIRWDYFLVGCWVLCALSLVLSVLGLRQVRLPLLFSSLAAGAFWTMVPIGVL